MSSTSKAFEPLTVREHAVAALLTEGLSNKRIAAQLVISVHTTKFHVSNVIIKLGASTRVDAAVKYARWLDAQPRVKRTRTHEDVVPS